MNSEFAIPEHYDLGNDLFKLFLDPSMFYSCGVFADTNKKVDAVDFKVRNKC